MHTLSWFAPLTGFILAPLLLGIINRTKAVFAGKQGQPLLQAYFDLARLLRKGATYSQTTTWIFRAGPIVGLAVTVLALFLIPYGSIPAPLAFTGDIVLLAYLLGAMRFFTVSAALDTGSAFEGMGASREVQFSALAEPALFLALATVALHTGEWSLSGMVAVLTPPYLISHVAVFAIVGVVLMVVFLTENARVPVDDPMTHLELTMIHEVMVLDHSGPDFGYILYSSALKLWILGSLVLSVLLPLHISNPFLNLIVWVGLMISLAVLVGTIESTMARLRLVKVPQLLAGASVLAVIALSLSF